MNEYYCYKCNISLYSSVYKENDVCPVCGSEYIINPEKEVSRHSKEFRKGTDTSTQKEE